MGVPAFYRWLSEKYSKIVVDMLEQRSAIVNGSEVPLDLTQPNPNGIEYDNLYIDMNGLIHPCSHPEDREAPATEEEMFVNVTMYVDRLFAAVRPRRLLFLAIDGVAPRAKMNQQRSRRFRAAQEAKERQEAMNDVLDEMKGLGLVTPVEGGSQWDSNVITPGTQFMFNLSKHLRFYILEKMNADPAWRKIKVVLSDANEPGEGEHKIMRFIRCQRSQPGYDPNQHHILHGLDADLIMLALATHEPNFTILREQVFFGKQQRDNSNGDKSQEQRLLDAVVNREAALAAAASSTLNPRKEWVYGKPLQALHISILREYLEGEFACLEDVLPFPYDFERVVDDFVFMCFFVGNDFLPHLPSLDIRDGAIDFLMECYKDVLPSLGEYLTSPGGVVNLRQADVILGRVGEIEDVVFRRRKEADEEQQRRRNQNQPHSGGNRKPAHVEQQERQLPSHSDELKASKTPRGSSTIDMSATVTITPSATGHMKTIDNAAAAAKIKESLLGKRDQRSSPTSDYNSKSPRLTEQSTVDISGKMEAVQAPMDASPVEDATESIESDTESEIDAHLGLKSIVAQAAEVEEQRLAKLELKKRLKDKESALLDKYRESTKDNVRLHELGWKDRYYEDPPKKNDLEQGGGLDRMVHTYVEGLCWVLKYYYECCPSWNWYYPFHYAPFASDLVNIDRFDIKFELASPFTPVEQLLAVLPADSVHALPKCCQYLMTEDSSPIKDLYCSDAPIDPNGKHLPWLWILLLPFIDEKRISGAFALVRDKMTLEERRRNKFSGSLLYLHHNDAICVNVIDDGLRYHPAPETDVEVLKGLSTSKKAGLDALYAEDSEDSESSDEESEFSNENERVEGHLPHVESNANLISSLGSSHLSDDPSISTSTNSILTPPTVVESLEMPPTESKEVAPDWFHNRYSSAKIVRYFGHHAGGGICGVISAPPTESFCPLNAPCHAPKGSRQRAIQHNAICCWTFDFPPESAYVSKLLNGFTPKPRVLTRIDLIPRRPPRLNKARFNLLELAQTTRQQYGQDYKRGSVDGYTGYNSGGYNFQGMPQYVPQQVPGYAYELGLQASHRMVENSLGRQGYDSQQRGYRDVGGNAGQFRGDPSFSGSYDSSNRGSRFSPNDVHYDRRSQFLPQFSGSPQFSIGSTGGREVGYQSHRQVQYPHGSQPPYSQHDHHLQRSSSAPSRGHVFSPPSTGSSSGQPISMQSMRAQLAQTLLQHQQQQQQQQLQPPRPAPPPHPQQHNIRQDHHHSSNYSRHR